MKDGLLHIGPLTKTQSFVLQHYLAEGDGTQCYHTIWHAHLQIEGLSLPLFFKAVRSVVERHPVLKTVFLFGDSGDVQQAVNPKIELTTGYQDISTIPDEEQVAWMDEYLHKCWKSSFDVYDPGMPLFRTQVVKRSREGVHLIISFHHAILDGWSTFILVKELLEHYQELTRATTLNLSPGDYEYADVIAYEEKVLQSKVAKHFWAQHLTAHSSFMPPKIEGAGSGNEYRPVTRVLPPEFSAAAAQLSKQLRVPLKSIFLGLFIRILQAETMQSNVTVGVIMNGRAIELKSPLTTLGLCWKIAPLCVEVVTDGAPFYKLVSRKIAEITAHVSYPVADIAHDTGVPDLFHAAFNFLNYEAANVVAADAGIHFLDVGVLDKFHCPLHLLVAKNHFDQTISVVFNYNEGFYTGAQIQEKLASYVNELQGVLFADQSRRVGHAQSS